MKLNQSLDGWADTGTANGYSVFDVCGEPIAAGTKVINFYNGGGEYLYSYVGDGGSAFFEKNCTYCGTTLKSPNCINCGAGQEF